MKVKKFSGIYSKLPNLSCLFSLRNNNPSYPHSFSSHPLWYDTSEETMWNYPQWWQMAAAFSTDILSHMMHTCMYSIIEKKFLQSRRFFAFKTTLLILLLRRPLSNTSSTCVISYSRPCYFYFLHTTYSTVYQLVSFYSSMTMMIYNGRERLMFAGNASISFFQPSVWAK